MTWRDPFERNTHWSVRNNSASNILERTHTFHPGKSYAGIGLHPAMPQISYRADWGRRWGRHDSTRLRVLMKIVVYNPINDTIESNQHE